MVAREAACAPALSGGVGASEDLWPCVTHFIDVASSTMRKLCAFTAWIGLREVCVVWRGGKSIASPTRLVEADTSSINVCPVCPTSTTTTPLLLCMLLLF